MTPDAIDPQALGALALGKPGIRRPREDAAQRDRPSEIRGIVEDDVVHEQPAAPRILHEMPAFTDDEPAPVPQAGQAQRSPFVTAASQSRSLPGAAGSLV